MAPQRIGAGRYWLRTLFRAGSAAGLTDATLLEQFASRDGEASEVAFAALVERHGPMVLSVCRAVLRDEDDAQDAFQATFLILVRRGGTLWVRNSVGPWLHQVACRAAARARRDARRRRDGERKAAEIAAAAMRAAAEPDREERDVGGVIHDEVDRLPDRYRIPLVLCDLEGRSYEDAAQSIGCPVGTVKSRLARGRERLRDRLTRRGLAPGAIVPGAARAQGTQAAVPGALAEAAVRAAIRPAASGAIPATVAALTEGVLKAMFLTRLKTGILVTLTVGIALGGLATGVRLRAQQGPEAKQAVAPPGKPEVKPPPPPDPVDSLAWRRTDRYEPPDLERFFPDDPEGGKRLDALWNDENKDKRPAGEIFRTVRQGLRRTKISRDQIMAWVGGGYIWNASPQNPDAIEILYHAADFRDKTVDQYDTRYNAVYYGLTVVQPKTPAILRTLVDMSMSEKTDWGRVAWGARSQLAELLSYLKPYLAAEDEATRDKASVIAKVLGGEPDANAAVLEWTRKTIRAKFGARLPEIRKALEGGSPRERLEALKLVLFQRIGLIMDDSFVDAFRACAQDKDAKVRSEVARTLGSTLFWFGGARKADAIGVLLRLSEDDDPDVRSKAVYFGLTPPPQERREEVIRRLLAMALQEPDSDIGRDRVRRIAWGLEQDRAEAATILGEVLRGEDPARACARREIYKEMTGRTPPGDASDPETRAGYAKALRDLYEHLGKVYPCFGIKGIDWDKVGRELLPRAAALESEEQFGLLVRELVARLEDSHAFVQEASATPPDPAMPAWDPGIACLIDDRGKPVVYVVGFATPARTSAVHPGMTVVAVNGVPAEEAAPPMDAASKDLLRLLERALPEV